MRIYVYPTAVLPNQNNDPGCALQLGILQDNGQYDQTCMVNVLNTDTPAAINTAIHDGAVAWTEANYPSLEVTGVVLLGGAAV